MIDRHGKPCDGAAPSRLLSAPFLIGAGISSAKDRQATNDDGPGPAHSVLHASDLISTHDSPNHTAHALTTTPPPGTPSRPLSCTATAEPIRLRSSPRAPFASLACLPRPGTQT